MDWNKPGHGPLPASHPFRDATLSGQTGGAVPAGDGGNLEVVEALLDEALMTAWDETSTPLASTRTKHRRKMVLDAIRARLAEQPGGKNDK